MLAVSMGLVRETRGEEIGETPAPRGASAEPGESAPPVRRDDPFIVPYLAVEAVPGLAGMPTPLVVVVSPPIKAGANPIAETYVQISRMPANATLSHGRDLGNGAWRIPLDDLPSLAITAPPDYVGTAQLSVTAISEHGDGSIGQRSVDLDVPIQSPKGIMLAGQRRTAEPANRVIQSTSTVTTEALAVRSVLPAGQPTPDANAGRPMPEGPKLDGPKPDTVVALAVPAPPPNPASQRSQGAPAPSGAAQKLLKRGDELFAQGDLAGARLFYQRAAAGGSAQAALALGRTYDPVILERMHVLGLSPDPEQAVRLYGEAVAKGVGDADRPLKDLTGWFAAHRK